jgi:hypothetical protein
LWFSVTLEQVSFKTWLILTSDELYFNSADQSKTRISYCKELDW